VTPVRDLPLPVMEVILILEVRIAPMMAATRARAFD